MENSTLSTLVGYCRELACSLFALLSLLAWIVVTFDRDAAGGSILPETATTAISAVLISVFWARSEQFPCAIHWAIGFFEQLWTSVSDRPVPAGWASNLPQLDRKPIRDGSDSLCRVLGWITEINTLGVLALGCNSVLDALPAVFLTAAAELGLFPLFGLQSAIRTTLPISETTEVVGSLPSDRVPPFLASHTPLGSQLAFDQTRVPQPERLPTPHSTPNANHDLVFDQTVSPEARDDLLQDSQVSTIAASIQEKIDEQGRRLVSGFHHFELAVGQKNTSLVIPICPAWTLEPEVDWECEFDGGDIEADVAQLTPSGIRFAIQRPQSKISGNGILHWQLTMVASDENLAQKSSVRSDGSDHHQELADLLATRPLP